MDGSEDLKSDWAEMLRARVLPNKVIRTVEELSTGCLHVEVPLKRRWFMSPPFSLVFPFRKTKRIELDAIGADVFLACEREPTVESLIDWFAEREGLSFHESRQTVGNYLRILMREGLIAMELPAPPE